MNMDNRQSFVAGMMAATAIMVSIMLVLMFFILVEESSDRDASFTLCNATGKDLNVTIFVLNGGDWDEIELEVANNTSIPLTITWESTNSVEAHIVYDDWDLNERVLRYHVADGENRIVVLT